MNLEDYFRGCIRVFVFIFEGSVKQSLDSNNILIHHVSKKTNFPFPPPLWDEVIIWTVSKKAVNNQQSGWRHETLTMNTCMYLYLYFLYHILHIPAIFDFGSRLPFAFYLINPRVESAVWDMATQPKVFLHQQK